MQVNDRPVESAESEVTTLLLDTLKRASRSITSYGPGGVPLLASALRHRHEETAESVRAMLRHPVSPNLNAASGVCFTLVMKLQLIDCLLHRAEAQG